jgi:hypothetical protein
MTTPTTPFLIHALAPEGINVVTRAVTPFTADSVTVFPGDSLEITAEILELNRDRDGVSWLEYDLDQQRAAWRGRVRFDHGPVPLEVLEKRETARLDALRRERQSLLQGNPALAKANAAAKRMASINEQLGD